MSRLFVTGMGRSGTSLLDKLLGYHREIDILSQPIPLVFIEAKRRFLQKIGRPSYFVLNTDLYKRSYSQSEIDEFLSTIALRPSELDRIFAKMNTYSGQKTRPDAIPTEGRPGTYRGFNDILERSFEYYRFDRTLYLGLKEIMCEEFMPYMLAHGYRCIVIIRDPRDVLASTNYPGREKFLGTKKPTLFVLRTWRKSVEYCRLLEGNSRFTFLRYEDLVDDPQTEMDKLAKFLDISSFEPGLADWGIKDRSGKSWSANSSRTAGYSGVSRNSIGTFREVLSESELEYTEAACAYEIKWLGYQSVTRVNPELCISGFKDQGIRDNHELSADFSSTRENITQELERLDQFKDYYSKH